MIVQKNAIPDELCPLLERLVEEAKALAQEGKVADYIPALACVDPNRIGISISTIDGKSFSAGDADVPFSIQSISKIFGLVMAMNRMGDPLWERVHMEPSGLPFNSIVQLEWEHGIPRNPFINAGAILISDVLVQRYSSSRQAFLSLVRQLSGHQSIFVNQSVLQSELEHGSKNAALAYLMKSFGNIYSDVQEVLQHYFFQCSVEMTCKQLSNSLTFLANKGNIPITNQPICSGKNAHRVNAILSTSGMYDQSGEFAFTVGLPAKSGVGGGIVAIVPGYGVITAWSPRLNSFGNSTSGMYLIENIAQELGLSVY